MTTPSPTGTDAATSDRGSSCARCSPTRAATPGAEGLTCGCATACGAPACLAAATVAPTPAQTQGDLEQDMRERLHPTATAIAHARALLDAESRAELAFIPMCLPGKTHGWWTEGQEVVTVPGVVLIAVNSFEDAGDIPSGSWARDAASTIARQELQRRKQTGVAAWATVRRTGHVAVFEDVL